MTSHFLSVTNIIPVYSLIKAKLMAIEALGKVTVQNTLMFIAALFTITKLWKQPRFYTTNKWIKKM
jgi:hypothetical protein